MKVVKSIAELRTLLDNRNGKVVGFVPTMGALHGGHVSLVTKCRRECDIVVVSVFVNPTQFNDANDLLNYPRTLDQDVKLLEQAGVDFVFAPEVKEMYPEPDTRQFHFGALESVMEGAHRPGHFNGVAQVVSKLLDIVKPNRAYFGQKDFQQVAIIRQMVKDCNIDVEIVGCEIVRGDDGLALSSRNALLSKTGRQVAPEIYATLLRGAAGRKTMSVKEVLDFVVSEIEKHPELKVDYFSIVDATTLQDVHNWSDSDNIRGCIAVKVENQIRLIDNLSL